MYLCILTLDNDIIILKHASDFVCMFSFLELFKIPVCLKYNYFFQGFIIYKKDL